MEKKTVFRCVQLGSEENLLTVDIELSRTAQHIVLVIYNLTGHYIEYQQLAQSRNESVINSERILIKNNELKERERFKNEFIQNFSHELRNPLTNIISLANVLGRTDLNESQIKTLQVLQESTGNLKLILEDILSIAMIAKGKLALNPSVFHFTNLLDFLLLTYTTRAREKGLAFVMNVDNSLPVYIEGDRLRLLQVLTNLCDNAIKYTNTGSVELKVSLNQKRANTLHLRFEVKDTGQGIPADKLSTILESFEQLGPTEGAGLGLAIVKGLLNLMDSEIVINSELGVGSYFYFDVSLRCPIHQPKAIVSESIKKLKKNYPTSKKFKVLLVEDDTRVQTALFKLLIDASGFYIDVVSDGALVVEEIVNNLYDIVLMDVNLPNVSGDAIVKVIRSLPEKRFANLPIIGVTAYSYEDQILSYLEAGMNAVLAKPFDEEELLQTMYRYLQ